MYNKLDTYVALNYFNFKFLVLFVFGFAFSLASDFILDNRNDIGYQHVSLSIIHAFGIKPGVFASGGSYKCMSVHILK